MMKKWIVSLLALVLLLSGCSGEAGENTGGQSDLTPRPDALTPAGQETPQPSGNQEDETTQKPETPQGGGAAVKATPYLTWDAQATGEWPLDCTLETLQFAGFEDEELSDANQQMRENTECEWQRYQDCAALSEEERFEQSASWGDIWAYPVSGQRYLNAVWVWRERMHFYTDEEEPWKLVGSIVYDTAQSRIVSLEEALGRMSVDPGDLEQAVWEFATERQIGRCEKHNSLAFYIEEDGTPVFMIGAIVNQPEMPIPWTTFFTWRDGVVEWTAEHPLPLYLVDTHHQDELSCLKGMGQYDGAAVISEEEAAGILAEEVLAQARQERLIGSFINVHEAAAEVGKICNAHRTEDIDFTVLLTHIGFEEDKKLAALLDPRWGVDVIIGGHTHTLLEEPCVVAGIPIVQAVTGTDQIGRFDIMVDTDTNSIDSYTWQLIPIDDSHCPRDTALEELIHKYNSATTEKYSRYITRFADTYTHPARNQETQLGRLFADLFRDNLGLDVMLLASGSLRIPEMGPIVTLRELTQMYPFHDEIFRITVTGAQLKNMIAHLFRPGALESDHSEFYQFSGGIRVVVSRGENRVAELSFEGAPIADDKLFRVGLQGYRYKNMKDFFGISEEEATATVPSKVIATNAMDVLDENLSRVELVACPEDERWIIVP